MASFYLEIICFLGRVTIYKVHFIVSLSLELSELGFKKVYCAGSKFLVDIIAEATCFSFFLFMAS